MPIAPAAALFEEALIYLSARGHIIHMDNADGRWILTIDGKTTTEGEIVAKAINLGMLGSDTIQ